MKKLIVMAIVGLFSCGFAAAQHHGNCGNCPNHGKHQGQQSEAKSQQPQVNADGVDMVIVKAFPTVKSIKKQANRTAVMDAQNNVLGYVVYSKPASDGIKGYNGETPVMIAFDKKMVITGVFLLQNQETPKFAKRVEDAGFYKNWNGLTVKQALKKEVDAVSGATFTSNAVTQSVRAALMSL